MISAEIFNITSCIAAIIGFGCVFYYGSTFALSFGLEEKKNKNFFQKYKDILFACLGLFLMVLAVSVNDIFIRRGVEDKMVNVENVPLYLSQGWSDAHIANNATCPTADICLKEMSRVTFDWK